MNYEFLKENADRFLENAYTLLEKGVYNLSAFNVEQAVQLYLKYLLSKKIGDFPRTHSLKRLLEDGKEFCPELIQIFEDNINTVGEIESAYITSRYYPMEFVKAEVENMLRVANDIREAIEGCL